MTLGKDWRKGREGITHGLKNTIFIYQVIISAIIITIDRYRYLLSDKCFFFNKKCYIFSKKTMKHLINYRLHKKHLYNLYKLVSAFSGNKVGQKNSYCTHRHMLVINVVTKRQLYLCSSKHIPNMKKLAYNDILDVRVIWSFYLTM